MLGCGRRSELSHLWFGTKFVVVKALDGPFPVSAGWLPLAGTPCQREKREVWGVWQVWSICIL